MKIAFSTFTEIFFFDSVSMANTNYNFEIITLLCEQKNRMLNKPIVILLAAIIECILYDFLRKIQEENIIQEKILELDPKSINQIKKELFHTFEKIITYIKEKDYFENDLIYKNLDSLRTLRNRIHIQNRSTKLKKEEFDLWTNENLKLAGQTLEQICKIMIESYCRPNMNFIPMSNFPRPWEY